MRHLFKMFALVIALTVTGMANSDLTIIDYKKAKGIYTAGSGMFIDARGAKLYKKGTIMGAINIPVKKYARMQKFLPNSKDAKMVVYCNGFKCEKSDELAVLLMKDGYTNVLVYKGGYPEWKKKKQELMGLVKECKENKGPYKPTGKMVTINGAKVYLGEDDGMIDQFWFASKVLTEMPANIQLVDVRKKSDYDEGHLPGAVNIAWDSKAEKIDTSKFPKDKLVVIYCNTGMMSTDAVGSLDEDVAKGVLYFDANVACKGEKCTVEANENL